MTAAPPDQQARDRIEHDLGTNLLVEAGAGSGKTTALVSRLLRHIVTGTPVEQLAAVTFTRKAADELRERFQLQLESVVPIPGPTPTRTHAALQRCAISSARFLAPFIRSARDCCVSTPSRLDSIRGSKRSRKTTNSQ